MDINAKPKQTPSYKSEMTRKETIIALAYLPVHIWLLPVILYAFEGRGLLTVAQVNVLTYAVGFVYMVALLRKFLRRDFDPLCDRPFFFLLELIASYGLMILMNLGVSLVLLLFGEINNQNNNAVMDLADMSFGSIKAMLVFMAPMIEELIFRAGIFGLLRRRSRLAAYGLSMLLFSVYHVWSYALAEPIYWVYLLQYLPVSFLLCRIYERTESIWGSILFHMMVNSVSFNAILVLEAMM